MLGAGEVGDAILDGDLLLIDAGFQGAADDPVGAGRGRNRAGLAGRVDGGIFGGDQITLVAGAVELDRLGLAAAEQAEGDEVLGGVGAVEGDADGAVGGGADHLDVIGVAPLAEDAEAVMGGVSFLGHDAAVRGEGARGAHAGSGSCLG